MKSSYSMPPKAGAPAVSASAMSITIGRRLPSCSSAGAMVAWNSRSARNSLASPCSRQKAISGASRRMLMGLSTAPSIGTA